MALCKNDPPCKSMEKAKDTTTMAGAESCASQEVMTAVNPSPPDMASERECSMAEACIIPGGPAEPAAYEHCGNEYPGHVHPRVPGGGLAFAQNGNLIP